MPYSQPTKDPQLDAFTAWKDKPGPDTTGELLRQLQPTIDSGISHYAADNDSPLLRSRARRLAIKAVKTYQPGGTAQLSTHVMNHMQGLRRISRQQQQILRVPERVSMDQGAVYAASTELQDQLGREPSLPELADYTGFSTRRLQKVMQLRPAIPASSLTAGDNAEEAMIPTSSLFRDEAVIRAIYSDLAPRDQKIVEWTTGLFGHKAISNREIANKLNITPGAVSQRKALLQQKINEVSAALN